MNARTHKPAPPAKLEGLMKIPGMANKGAAAPVNTEVRPDPAPGGAGEGASVPVELPGGTAPAAGQGGVVHQGAAPAASPAQRVAPGSVAVQDTGGVKSLTVKLDRARYKTLKQLGLELDRTGQDMMVEAFDFWLAARKSSDAQG